MSVLSKNPLARFDVEQEWEAWSWFWNDNKEYLRSIKSRFLDELGQDWEYWQTELILISTVCRFNDYSTDAQTDRALIGMDRLGAILHKITGEPITIRAYSNPQGGLWMVPEYEIRIGEEGTDTYVGFIFKVKDQSERPLKSILGDYKQNLKSRWLPFEFAYDRAGVRKKKIRNEYTIKSN